MSIRITRKGWLAIPLAFLLLATAACGGDDDDDAKADDGGGSGALSGNINLVAYSTPQEAYKEIEAAFQQTDEGKDVKFTESFGPSGDQSRAVEAGQPADYVGFSLEPDITRLVKAGLVADDWNKNDYKGQVTNSVVVLAVRKGNPKDIEGWDDLIKDDVEVITPNPFQSGGAMWNILAAYGAQLEQGKSEDEAKAYLKKLFDHVPVQDESARKALQTFTGGKGDVLIAYENEAIFAQQAGEDIEYVVPDQTILIENPIAVTSNSENPDAAQAFAEYVYTPEAQEIFVKNGYRPVVDGIEGADEFPTPEKLFDITKFGGWSDAKAKFFDPESDSIMKVIEEDLGVATSK